MTAWSCCAERRERSARHLPENMAKFAPVSRITHSFLYNYVSQSSIYIAVMHCTYCVSLNHFTKKHCTHRLFVSGECSSRCFRPVEQIITLYLPAVAMMKTAGLRRPHSISWKDHVSILEIDSRNKFPLIFSSSLGKHRTIIVTN